MERRALLAGFAGLLAGCFSGTDPQSGQADGTPTPTETRDAETPTPTESTATPTPQQTRTTPSGDRVKAADKIETAQDRLMEAVYIYSGGVSNDLLDVSAESTEFDARSTLLKLHAVQTAVDEAEAVAATDRQRRTIDALHQMRRFMTQATDLQAWLIDGHEAVADAHDALDNGDAESKVTDKLDALDRVVTNTEGPLRIITEEIDPASASVTDAVDTTEYEQKRTQFEHEQSVLVTLQEALSAVHSARKELDAARTKADQGDFLAAAEAADRVAENLEDTVERLEDLDTDPPSRADAFEDIVADTLDLVRDQARTAENLHDQYD